MGTKTRENITISIIVTFVVVLGIFAFLPNYKYAVNGAFSGADFELSLEEGREMGNYTSTDLDGDYGPLSISGFLPHQEACLSKVDIKREDGALSYGGIREESMAHRTKAEMDQCIIKISQYFDNKYGDKVVNYNTFK